MEVSVAEDPEVEGAREFLPEELLGGVAEDRLGVAAGAAVDPEETTFLVNVGQPGTRHHVSERIKKREPGFCCGSEIHRRAY